MHFKLSKKLCTCVALAGLSLPWIAHAEEIVSDKELIHIQFSGETVCEERNTCKENTATVMVFGQAIKARSFTDGAGNFWFLTENKLSLDFDHETRRLTGGLLFTDDHGQSDWAEIDLNAEWTD